MQQAYFRPLSFGEVLDGAFSLYRANFLRFFLTALIPFIPVAVVWAVLGTMFSGNGEGLVVLELAQVVMTPYSVLASALVWGALALQSDQAYRGETPSSWQDSYLATLGRLPTLIGALILAIVGMTIGFFLLIIPGILVGIMLFAVVPVVMIERRGVFDSLGRSKALAKGAWGRIFAVVFLLLIITAIPMMSVGFVSVLGILASGDAGTAGGGALVAMQLASVIGTALTTPFLVVGIVLQYYDRRVRAEGLDLQIATEQLSIAG